MPAKPVDNASSGRVGAHALYMDCLGVYEPGYLARIGVDSRVDANSAIRYYEDGDWYLEPDDARLLVDVGDGRWVKAGQCDCVVSTIGGDGERQTKIIARDTVDSILAALSVSGMWHVKDDDVIRPWGEKAEEAHAYYSGERAFYGSAYVALPGADWRGDLSGAGVDVDALGALQVGSAVLWGAFGVDRERLDSVVALSPNEVLWTLAYGFTRIWHWKHGDYRGRGGFDDLTSIVESVDEYGTVRDVEGDFYDAEGDCYRNLYARVKPGVSFPERSLSGVYVIPRRNRLSEMGAYDEESAPLLLSELANVGVLGAYLGDVLHVVHQGVLIPVDGGNVVDTTNGVLVVGADVARTVIDLVDGGDIAEDEPVTVNIAGPAVVDGAYYGDGDRVSATLSADAVQAIMAVAGNYHCEAVDEEATDKGSSLPWDFR